MLFKLKSLLAISFSVHLLNTPFFAYSTAEGIYPEKIISEYVNWENVSNTMKIPPVGWEDTIEKALTFPQNVINPTIIEQKNTLLSKNSAGLCLCSIKNNSLSFASVQNGSYLSYRTEALRRILQLLVNKNLIYYDVTFFVSLHDICSGNKDTITMAMCRDTNEANNNIVLIPDIIAIATFFNGLSHDLLEASENFAFKWENKLNTIFWRGRATGCHGEQEKCLRGTLVAAGDTSQRLDVGFVNQSFNSKHKLAYEKYGIKKRATPIDHLKYKYLIYIDSGSFSTSLTWQLLANSALIKIETHHPQWFDHLLVPYKHYIPLKRDLSNLQQVINWCDTHDKEAQAIANESTNFALENLSIEASLAYYALLLNALGEKQTKLSKTAFNKK